jgi:hypothetical protein
MGKHQSAVINNFADAQQGFCPLNTLAARGGSPELTI